MKVVQIMARIYDLWDGSLDQRKVRGSGLQMPIL